MKGIIALDIDGTITAEHHSIDPAVVDFLETVVSQEWKLIFITGRTFLWGYAVLKALQFPYYFAVQNGAIILDMPSRRIVSKKYLDTSIFPIMESICAQEPSDFVVYTGFEQQDRCFFRPDHFDSALLDYIEYRVKGLHENWTPLKSFRELQIPEFPSVKCFGAFESAQKIAQQIEERLGLHVPLIRDPFNENYYVAQATHALVSKGYAVQDFKKIIGNSGPVIAAGDDRNDRTMLDIADIKIVMATAPQELLALADIVAPSAQERGIIAGLTEAIQRVR